MPKLSAIIIVKNEANNIVRCLRSIHGWVDEIIILDSGSTDQTVTLCRQYSPHVYSTDWPGYGPQKNRALSLAHGDWVLSLDADEWIRPALRAEIQQAIRQSDFQSFYIPRLNMFCGRFQRYGDASKDKVLRLFRRGAAQFSEDLIHEKVVCSGATGQLQNPLLHNSSRTKTEWAAQMQKYALLTAELRYTQGRRSNPIKAGINAAWIFFRSYLLRGGFRDGRMGWLYATLNAKSSFTKNMRIWRLGQLNKSGNNVSI